MRGGADDPVVFVSRVLEVPEEQAESSLQRQPDLPSPAKLVRCEGGETGIVAEVPRLVPPETGAALARRAVEEARAWLDHDGDAAPEPTEPPISEDEALADLLGGSGYAWRRLDDGDYGLDVTHGGVVGRIELRPLPARRLRLCARGAVGVGDGRGFLALTHYALEANRRLRVARISVGTGGGAAAWVVWDVVLPAELPREAALREGIGAVATARALTEAAVRALANPTLADAYLALRANFRPGANRRKKT